MQFTGQIRAKAKKAAMLPGLVVISLLAACAPVPRDAPKQMSFAQIGPPDSYLVAAAKRVELNSAPGQSTFAPLNDGNEGLGARLRLIEQAEHTLDLQYFLMKRDLAGSLVVQALFKAADRGVRVRLLLDDVFTSVPDDRLGLLDRHPNVELRLFNPAARPAPKSLSVVTDFSRLNRRMHNKSFTADGVVSIVGGRNIADEYYQIDTSSEFADFDLVLVGSAVRDVSANFDLFWNDSWAVPMKMVRAAPSAEALVAARAKLDADLLPARAVYQNAVNDRYLVRLSKGEEPLFSGEVEVVTDHPDKLKVPLRQGERRMAESLLTRFKNAKHEVILLTPYFVPEDYGAALFATLAARGVRVRIVTNSIASTNHTYVQAGYERHRKMLLRAGVELHEVRADALQVLGLVGPESDTYVTMHTKLAMIDGDTVFVGSLNLDPRSVKQNSETGVFLSSRKFADFFKQNFNEGAPLYTYRLGLTASDDLIWHYDNPNAPFSTTSEPGDTFLKGVLVGVTRLMGVELQL